MQSEMNKKGSQPTSTIQAVMRNMQSLLKNRSLTTVSRAISNSPHFWGYVFPAALAAVPFLFVVNNSLRLAFTPSGSSTGLVSTRRLATSEQQTPDERRDGLGGYGH